MIESEILNINTAASYLKLHPKTLRRMAGNGELPAYKIRSEWRFRRSELDRWLDGQAVPESKLKVLVVDDMKAVCEALRMIFEDKGFIPTIAHNGQGALTILENFIPDVIVLDLNMPVMNGPETLKHIRERYGNIPVVILTAYADTDLMREALKWAPFMVVRKPMEPEELISAVRAAAAGKVLAQATVG